MNDKDMGKDKDNMEATNVNVVTSENPQNISAENVNTEKEKKEKKLKSKVWLEMTKQKIDGIEVAICPYCHHKFTGASTSGTSHLKRHLTSCPRKNSKDIRQQLLTRNVSSLGGEGSIIKFEFSQARSREQLAQMIMIHEYPFSIIEHWGFKRFIRNLQPEFNMVSRNTIKTDCIGVYEQEKKKLHEFFDNFSGRVSITTDMWTSNQTLGYSCLTAHFIDDGWVLQKRIINFQMEPSPHTAENLCSSLYKCLLDWNIDRKIMSITVDNCTTNDLMVELLKDELSSNLLLGGDLFHVRCSAHILNLIVQDGLKALGDVVRKVRDSVKYVTGSQGREQLFKDICKQAKISCDKRLIKDVPTRWNSTYKMLETALIYKDAFQRLEHRDSVFRQNVAASEDEWQRAKIVCDLLETFYNASNMFSGSNYPTANLFFDEICEIRLKLHEEAGRYNFLQPVVTAMLEKFLKYWKFCHLPLACAIVMDLRFKLKLLEYYYPKFYDSLTAKEEVKMVVVSISNIYKEYLAKGNISTKVGSSESSSSNSISTAKRTKRYSQFLTQSSSMMPTKTDLDLYLEEAVFPLEEDTFDVLAWWKSNAARYPILSLMARDVLAIPLSTVASESAFSTSGRVLDQYRSSLHPKTVEALICGQDWLKNSIKGQDGASKLQIHDAALGSVIVDEEKDDA